MNKYMGIVVVLLLSVISVGAADWNYTPLPLLFYTSDTGFAGGALLVAERSAQPHKAVTSDVDSPDGKGGALLWQTAATYTQKQQAELSSLFQSDIAGGRYRLNANIGFFSTPSVFYGIGPHSDFEESYDQQKFDCETSFMCKLWRQLYAGPSYLFNYVEYTAYKPEGGISRSVDSSDPADISSEIGFICQWDSRSSLVYPRDGSYIEFRALRASSFLGSEHTFTSIKLDARTYCQVFPDIVLALQAVAGSHSGEVPLHKMEELGGLRVLRGYQFGRFKDKNSAALQSEVRFPIFRRLGGVVFGGVGQVEESFDKFLWSHTKVAGGVGFRFRPNKESDVRIRLDVGLSPDSTGIYITLMEAF